MKVLKFFGKFIAFIYSIIFFFILNALLLLLCLSSMLNPSFYGKVVSSIDFSKIKVTDIISDKTDEIKDKTLTLEDYLVDQLEENSVPTDSAKKIVNDKDIKDLIGTFMGDVAQYYIFENETPQINSNQIKSIVEKLNLKNELDDNNISIDVLVEKINSEMIKQFPIDKNTTDIRESDTPEELKLLFEVADTGRLVIILCSFIICSYLLFALLTWSFIKPMNFMGIPILIIGVLFLILRFASGFVISLLGNAELLSFIELFTIVLKPFLIVGIACLASGLLLIVLHSNIISVKSKDISKDEPNFDIEDNTIKKQNNVNNEEKSE